MNFKKITLGVFLLVTTVSFTGNAIAENTFEKEVTKEKGAIKLVREIQRGDYDVVSTETLNNWINEKKDMIIIDTMPYEGSYKKNHIPGAKQFLFPIPDMKTWDKTLTDGKTIDDFNALLGADKNKTIIFYCGFVKCTRSHNGAVWAKKSGYKNVYRQPGGIFAWKGAGYEVAKVKR